MHKKLCGFLLSLFLLCPSSVFAVGADLNFHFSRQEDGTTLSELWYNNQIVWRLQFLYEGARPVSSSPAIHTTTVIPDIVNGCFLLKIE